MSFNNAFVRAIRTGAQTLAALLLSVPVFNTLLDVQLAVRQVFAVAVANAALAAVIAFLQNVAEDNTDIDVPK